MNRKRFVQVVSLIFILIGMMSFFLVGSQLELSWHEKSMEDGSFLRIVPTRARNEDALLVKASLTFANISVPFVTNQGQADKEVAFYAKTFGGTVFVTKDGEVVYDFPKYEESDKGRSTVAGGVVLKERFLGALVKGIEGERPAVTKVHYFKGRNPAKWQKNITTYNFVSLGEIYEGIEVKLRAHASSAEELFYIHPGANPEQISVEIKGAESLKVDRKTGDLVLETELGEVRFKKPTAYYLEEPNTEIKVFYRVIGKDEYTFALSSYDTTRTVVIDPLLASTFLGGGGSDLPFALAVDAEGNVYVAGETDSLDFPSTEGAYHTSHNGIGANFDAFVAKLNQDLSQLLASTYLGGSADDTAHALALDSSGEVYVAGYTGSSDFPTTEGTYDATYNGGANDAFISKLSGDLSTLIASTYLGGANVDYAVAMALDALGDVYVAGWTMSDPFPTTEYAFDRDYNNGRDAFVSKLSGDLKILLSSTYLGGSGDDGNNALSLDGSGNVYVAGFTWSQDFPTTDSAFRRFNGGDRDAFVSKLSSDLSALVASTYLGGTGWEWAYSLDLDSTGNVYVAVWTNSSNFPTTRGAYDESLNGDFDASVSKLSGDLGSLLASTYLGGTERDLPYALVVDPTDNVYVGGYTLSSDFPATQGAYDASHNGGEDAFVTKLSPDLSNVQASTFLGDWGDEKAFAIALDGVGNVYVVGVTDSRYFPTTSGAYDKDLNNDGPDAFVSKFDSSLSSGATPTPTSVPTTPTPMPTPTPVPATPTPTPTPAANVFGDVPDDHWAVGFINRLYRDGITGGCALNPLRYCPDNPVSRAQMAVFLIRGIHYPEAYTPPDVAPTFPDTAGHWAEDWIEALKAAGITSGYPDGTYKPDVSVTRAQMAVFLLKAEHGADYWPPAVEHSRFSDVPDDYWAKDWIEQLAAEGITSGYPDGTYRPENPVSRAEMAVFLLKTFELP